MNTILVRVLFYPVEILILLCSVITTYTVVYIDSMNYIGIFIIIMQWSFVSYMIYLDYKGLYNYFLIWALYMDTLSFIRRKRNTVADKEIINKININREAIDQNIKDNFKSKWFDYIEEICLYLDNIS